MTVHPDVVLARLVHLGHVLVQLERLRAMTPAERSADPLVVLAAERALHVAAEAIFDIGHHLLAGRGLRVPSTYREVVPALAVAGALPSALAERLGGMAGMRNILVHDYVAVDTDQVWRAIDEHTGDLRAVHAAFAALPEIARAAT